MRSFISRTTAYFLFCLAMICIMVVAGSTALCHAAGDSVKVTVPYTHIYDAEKDRSGDSFTYQVEPLEQAPAPNGSEGGVYYFTVKAKPEAVAVTGNVDLTIPFAKPGVYKYKVSAYVPEKKKGFTYEDRVYTLNVVVSNSSEGGLQALVTASGEDGRKYSRLQLNPAHASKEVTVVSKPINTPDGDGNQTVTVTRPAANNPSQARNLGDLVRDYLNDEEDVTLRDLVDEALPKADYDRNYWALLNLILLVITIGIAFIMIWRYLSRVDTDEDDYIIRREGKLRLLGLIPAIVAGVTFFRTEDFGLHMKLTDEWTVFMAVMLGVELICAFIAYWKYDNTNNVDGNGPGNSRMEEQAV